MRQQLEMVQLLVNLVDKTNPDDFYADCACPKRGDVIDAFEDSVDLSIYKEMLNNPDWAVVKVPGTIDDVRYLLEAEHDTNPKARVDSSYASQTLQYRANKFDIDSVIAQGKAQEISEVKATPIFEIAAMADVIAAVDIKAAIADPALIGPEVSPIDPNLIG